MGSGGGRLQTTGTFGTLGTLAFLTLGVRATFASLGLKIVVLLLLVNGVTLSLGLPRTLWRRPCEH